MESVEMIDRFSLKKFDCNPCPENGIFVFCSGDLLAPKPGPNVNLKVD
jgi:hypothetical protein